MKHFVKVFILAPFFLLFAIASAMAQNQVEETEDSSLGCMLGPRMLDQLNLTPGQEESIGNIYDQTLMDLDALHEQLDRAQAREDRITSSSMPNKNQLLATRKEIKTLQQKIQKRWTQYRTDVLGELTTDQRAEYLKVSQSAPSWGRGYGRGGRYGYGRGYGYRRGAGYGRGYGCGRGVGYGRGYRRGGRYGRGYGRGRGYGVIY